MLYVEPSRCASRHSQKRVYSKAVVALFALCMLTHTMARFLPSLIGGKECLCPEKPSRSWPSSARPSSSAWHCKRTHTMPALTMIQALNLALKQEMANDDSIIVLGEDVGVDGGVFRVTEGLLKTFGEERVLDTPLAESGIVGFAIG